MKKRILAALITVLCLLLFTSHSIAGENAAVVNGTPITMKEIDIALKSLPQYRKLQIEVLKTIILNRLLYQESQKTGIKIEPSEIEKNFKQFVESLGADEKTVEKKLAEKGVTVEEMKQEIEKQLAILKLLSDFDKKSDTTVSDAEAKIYYEEQPEVFRRPEQIRVSNIMIKVSPSASSKEVAEAREKITKIMKELESGKGFSETAKQYSEDDYKNKGGDIGFITRQHPFAKSFLDAAFSLKKGEVSGIVKTIYGFHLIKVTDRKPAMKFSFEDVKERIKESLVREKIGANRKIFEKRLMEKADIQILLGK